MKSWFWLNESLEWSEGFLELGFAALKPWSLAGFGSEPWSTKPLGTLEHLPVCGRVRFLSENQMTTTTIAGQSRSKHGRTDKVLYCIALYCIVLYCIVLYCIVLYCIVLYCIVLYCIVLYCTVLYCTVLYCIALNCITLHCIVLICLQQSIWLSCFRTSRDVLYYGAHYTTCIKLAKLVNISIVHRSTLLNAFGHPHPRDKHLQRVIKIFIGNWSVHYASKIVFTYRCGERGPPRVVTKPVNKTRFSNSRVADKHHFKDSLWCGGFTDGGYTSFTHVLLLSASYK